ncbi:MAG: hypothetical protein ACRDSJ_06025 [Rubrobacteraceae bacterium]
MNERRQSLRRAGYLEHMAERSPDTFCRSDAGETSSPGGSVKSASRTLFAPPNDQIRLENPEKYVI